MDLHTLVQEDDLAALRQELAADASRLEARDADGLTPLMVAAGWGRLGALRLLIDAGADVLALDPVMGVTPLHKAAQGGHADVLEVLIDNGAFIDQQTPALGNTALMDAAVHKHPRAVGVLLRRGAKTTLTNHWQQTALDVAVNDDLPEIVDLIRDRNRRDARQAQSDQLMAAVTRGDVEAVKDHLRASAPLEERTPFLGRVDDDNTPLGAAARLGQAAMVELLLRAGADADVLNGLMGATPAHEAAYAGHAEVIDVLSTVPGTAGTRVDLDARGAYNGFTALHDAVWHGHRGAVRALLIGGASTSLLTHCGQTAQDLAEEYGYTEIVDDLAGRDGTET